MEQQLDGRKEDADGRKTGVHPFSVFPEELWGQIGEKLSDSREIFNLIAALPPVEGVLEAKKRCWLFDQVIPLLSPWLGVSDRLACRQVCKQWSHSVDNFLENYPVVRAYDHDNLVTGQIWTVEGRPTDIHGYSIVPSSSFSKQEEMTEFLQIMGDPPGRWRNPFMYRVINIDSSQEMQVVAGASGIIEKYGKHVWSLTMYDEEHEDPQPFCHALRGWLDRLPNLKSLRLLLTALINPDDYPAGEDFDDDADDEEDNSDLSGEDSEPDEEAEEIPDPGQAAPNADPDEILNLLVAQDVWNMEEAEADELPVPVEAPEEPAQNQEEPAPIPQPAIPAAAEYYADWNGPLPPLPHLDNLFIHSIDFPPFVLHALVDAYSRQIRRLDLHICHWKPTFYTAFPQLTQLTVFGIPSNVEMNYLLLFIEAPLLYSIELNLREGSKLDLGVDIFPWLRRFPLIRNLSFGGEPTVIGENNMFSPEACSIPSLKYLGVGKQFLHANSDFLLCFPNLEYLHIDSTEQELDVEPPLEPTLKMWEHMIHLRMYESNVWELLPKLKGLSVTDDDNILPEVEEEEARFKRATYDHRRRNLGQENQAN